MARDVSRPEDLAADVGLHDDGYQLSAIQAQEILNMRLHRLTGLEQEKLTKEYEAILGTVRELLHILSDPERLMEVIREELEAIREEYDDERRTEILQHRLDLSLEDLITEEDVVVTISHGGYVKSQTLDRYQAQRRGGKGKKATRVKEEDFIDELFVANTHDTMLCFTSQGRIHWLKVYELPQASHAQPRQADCEPVAAGKRRAGQCGAAGTRVPAGSFRVLRHPRRYRQENPAYRLLTSARQSASGPSTWMKMTSWSMWPLPTASGTSCCFHPSGKCIRFAEK